MPSRNIIPKQGNAKALRAKRKREPQVHENAKTAIIIKGRKTSQDVTDALKDIVSGLIGQAPRADGRRCCCDMLAFWGSLERCQTWRPNGAVVRAYNSKPSVSVGGPQPTCGRLVCSAASADRVAAQQTAPLARARGP